MEPAITALGSALAFGVCDFLAGISARRLSYWYVALVSLVTSVVGAWSVVATTNPAYSVAATAWGCAAGVGAALGSSALYRGYGLGQMAVAGPVSAVGAAALPAVVGVAIGESLPVLGIVGVAVALPAIWLISGAGTNVRTSRRGSVEGLISGAGFGLEFIGLERAGSSSGLWPVAVSQTTALVLVGLVVALQRPAPAVSRRPIVWAVLAGALSLVATSLYFAAATAGLLTVAAVLAGLYPAVTVALAAAVLREHPDRSQLFGLALGAVAVVLIVTG
jgi:uncharacterized membrane protein